MSRKKPSGSAPELIAGTSESVAKQKGSEKKPTPRMMREGDPLDTKTLFVLRERCTISSREAVEGMPFAITILDEVERPVYELLNELFERMGGKYVQSKRVHGFPYDPTPMLEMARVEGAMPPRNPLDFFRTTPLVLEKIRGWIDPERRKNSLIPSPFDYFLSLQEEGTRRFRILEPSAGDGVIGELLRELFPTADLFVCEMDPYRRKILEKKGFQLLAEDFLKVRKGEVESFDLIIMNPPFSDEEHGKSAYIAHILHAFSLLRDHNSQLVTVAPAGFLTDKHQPYYDFLTFCLIYGTIEDLPREAFKESATTTKCVLIWIDQEPCWPHSRAEEPCNGYPNGYVSMFFDHVQWEESHADQVSKVLDQMVTGELIVYSDGRAASATRERIIEVCKEISARERYKLNHLPIRPQDHSFYIEGFLVMLENSYEERVDRLRASFREKRQTKWQFAVQEVEVLQSQVVKIGEQITALRKEVLVKEAQLVHAQDKAAHLEQELEASPDWEPPARVERPEPTSLLDLFTLPEG